MRSANHIPQAEASFGLKVVSSIVKDCKKQMEDYVAKTICGLQSLKYLLSDPLQRKFADSCSNTEWFYLYSEIEGNTKNIDTDFHSLTTCSPNLSSLSIPLIKTQHSLMSKSVF